MKRIDYWSPEQCALRTMREEELDIMIREGCNELDAPQLMAAGSTISEDDTPGTTLIDRDDLQ